MVVRRVAGALVVLTVALGSAGCGDDETPAPSTTSVASPKKGPALTPTETSSSTSGTATSGTTSPTSGESAAPDLPEAATKNTKAGAMAFAEFYTVQVGEAFRTGDTTALKALGESNCVACKALVDGIDELRADGLHAERNPNTDIRAEQPQRSERGLHVRVNLAMVEYDLVDQDGKRVERSPRTVGYYTHLLHWRAGQWRVVDSVLSV
ncbi:DUF6318 family protein [Janibacter sp. GXQ6167]|uniref:DUF6318 family protein n=1 Tax=Janibacter sp. GXQ6167 TaxID=3240791 RepID=UPI00352591A8